MSPQASRGKLIWTPDHSDGDIGLGVKRMFKRLNATQAMLDGELEIYDYLDFIDSHQIDVFDLVDLWESTGEFVI